eukprot:jgi/Orpsp1_1/1179422/evm.model.c7180000069293.1
MNDEESNNNKNIIKCYPKYNNSFENLFKTEKNKNLLIDFLNDVLDCKNNDPIVNIQYMDTEITSDKAKNAIILDKLDNLSLKEEEKEVFYKQLNVENKHDTDENVNTKKRKNKNTFDQNINKIIKTDSFYRETDKLNLLVSSMRESYLNEKNKYEFTFLKFDNNPPFFAITKARELINIKIEVQETENMCKRSLLYASDIIFRSLPKGCIYDDVPRTVLIIFSHYNIFKNKNKFHWCFSILDKETKTEENFEGLLNIHFIELSKFEHLKKEEKNNEKYRWFLFMVDPNNNVFLNKNTPSQFTQARNTLLSLEENKNYINICNKEKEMYDSYINGLDYREEKGKREGREEGRKEGIEEGIEEGIKIVRY